MSSHNQELIFTKLKEHTLKKIDHSKKGSYDVLIIDLINFINDQKEWCTTSSCSGRICVLSNESSNDETSKMKNCVWHLLSHEPVSCSEVLESLKSIQVSTKLKFEGFVMHVRCMSLNHARLLHQAAVSSGFRNSGISLGKKGRNIVLAIRGTLCLEVPLTDSDGKLMTSRVYVEHVVNLANTKLTENSQKIKRFEKNLKLLLASQHVSTVQNNEKVKPKKRGNNLKIKSDYNQGYEFVDDAITSLFDLQVSEID